MVFVPLVVSDRVRESPLKVHFLSNFVHVLMALISHLFEHSSQVLVNVTVLCAVMRRLLLLIKVSLSSRGHFFLYLKIMSSSTIFATIDLV